MTENKITLLSWNSYGEMSLLIRDKEHTYRGVTIDLYFKIKALIKYRNWKAVFKILNTLRKEQEDDKS